MLTWLFSILFGKVMLLSAGPLMIIGGVALMVLGFRKYGLWVLVAGGIYIGASMAEAALAEARAENERLIDERQAKDVADIAREAEEEIATTPPAGPAPP